MKFPSRFRHIAALLALACAPAWLHAAAANEGNEANDAKGVDALQPALEAEPGGDGLVTWWLVSGAQKISLADAKPPLNAREGEEVAGGGGKWRVNVNPPDRMRYVDLKPFIHARTGVVWASVRLRSVNASTRKLRIGSFCAVKVFRDGQLVLQKPQPLTRDEASGEIDVPAGACELTVGVAIRSGFAGFQCNLTAGRALGGLPRPVAGDRLLLPAKRGVEPDAGAAAVRGMLFVSKEMFVQPGKPVILALAVQGSIPLGVGPLEPLFKGPDGAAFHKPFPARALGDVAKAHWQVEYPVPKDAGFEHDVTVELKSGEKVVGSKKLALYSFAGLREAIAQSDAELQKQRAATGKPFPNAMLAIEKLRLYAAKIASGEEYASRELGATLAGLLDLARKSIADEGAGRDPFAGRGGYFERAYISAIDEQAQPYLVNIPQSVIDSMQKKDGRKFPIVIFLHGYVPSYDKHHWWDDMPDFDATLERHDCLLAIPFGRSNTDFQSCGEVDVMDVLAAMKRLYPVDEDRVYIYGYSMGGMGVYTVAAHHPDVFAAGIAFCGRADNPLQNFKPLQSFHPYKQWLIHADNPIDQCENLLNLPLRIYHGREDTLINIGEARRMQRRIKELAGDAELIEMPGDHWYGFDLMGRDEITQWLLSHKRNTHPERRHIKAYSLRQAAQGEVRVTAIKGELKPVELEWKTAPAVEFIKDSEQIVQREIGGKAIPEKIDGLRKRPELCGPVREAICGAFMIVYGTTGTPAANKQNKENAERFAKEWFAFTRSKALIKADKDVSEADKAAKNLFLFGQENENALHAAAAKDLPFSVKNGSVTIGDKTFPLAGHGFIYIYPNPLNGGRTSLVICAGIPYGKDIGTNHKLDLLPDFLLYDEATDADGTGTNKFICAGFFNGEWKLDPALMWQAGK